MPPPWKEELPLDCPPEGASVLSNQTVLRLVSSATPTAADFLSYAALGLTPKGDDDPCTRCACSVFYYDEKIDRARQLRKLPTLGKRKHVAYLTLTDTAGVGVPNQKTGHISWWIAHSFDPVAAITKVESVQ
jgi:hypothetical protein